MISRSLVHPGQFQVGVGAGGMAFEEPVEAGGGLGGRERGVEAHQLQAAFVQPVQEAAVHEGPVFGVGGCFLEGQVEFLEGELEAGDLFLQGDQALLSLRPPGFNAAVGGVSRRQGRSAVHAEAAPWRAVSAAVSAPHGSPPMRQVTGCIA